MFKTSLVKFSLMKRFILILVLAMASAVASSAQTDLSYKEWSDGPLRIEDFSTRKTPGDEMGKIYTGIQTYQGDWEKVSWNLRVKRLQSKAVFDSIRSWVRGDMLTDQAVRYGQLLFDATELTRRQMQNHLATGPHEADYHSVVRRYFDIGQARVDEIASVTEEGKNLDELEIQECIIADELANLSEIDGGIPEYTLRKFAVCVYAGAASQFNLGEYSLYFTPCYGFLWGFDVGIGRSSISWDIVLGGGSRLLKDVPGDELDMWHAGRKLMGGETSVQYAYDVYDGNVFRVRPFAGVGIGYMDYSNPDRDSDVSTDEMGGLRLLAGLSLEFKYLRSLYLVGDPLWSSVYGGRNEHTLKVKVYVARTSYAAHICPYSINCSLTFNFLSKFMKP